MRFRVEAETMMRARVKRARSKAVSMYVEGKVKEHTILDHNDERTYTHDDPVSAVAPHAPVCAPRGPTHWHGMLTLTKHASPMANQTPQSNSPPSHDAVSLPCALGLLTGIHSPASATIEASKPSGYADCNQSTSRDVVSSAWWHHLVRRSLATPLPAIDQLTLGEHADDLL